MNLHGLNKKHYATIIIICILIPLGFLYGLNIGHDIGYEKGIEDGSVESRTPNFEMTIVGGHVNESVYNETYYQVYYFADRNPPTFRNDSFILVIAIIGYYDNTTDVAAFGVKFSEDIDRFPNVVVERVVVHSGREEGWEVGLMFNFTTMSGVVAYGLGWMNIIIFGHGSVEDFSSLIASHILTIQEWEG